MNTDLEIIKLSIDEHLSIIKNLPELSDKIKEVADILAAAAKNDNHLFICGNGGSAADSQHFSAEYRGRFEKERKGLKATALTVDTSSLTAIGNDYGFEDVFSRQLEALASQGDVVFLISTSGKSKNILKAAEAARAIGVVTIALTGNDGGELANVADYSIIIPSKRTARIQEAHELIIHILCELIDARF